MTRLLLTGRNLNLSEIKECGPIMDHYVIKTVYFVNDKIINITIKLIRDRQSHDQITCVLKKQSVYTQNYTSCPGKNDPIMWLSILDQYFFIAYLIILAHPTNE